MIDSTPTVCRTGHGDPEPFPAAPAAFALNPDVTNRLRDLRSGEAATVTGLDASRLATKRLADLGFIPGVRVEMLRCGVPCLVRVNGICLGLGAGHQDSILLNGISAR